MVVRAHIETASSTSYSAAQSVLKVIDNGYAPSVKLDLSLKLDLHVRKNEALGRLVNRVVYSDNL